MDIKTFKEALPILFQTKRTPLLTGLHGVGKSQCVAQAVADMGGKVWDFRLGQMSDTGDIIGLLDIDNSKDYCEFKIPKHIHDLIEFCNNNPDKYGVLFFDEINRTTKDILQSVFQVVYDHELNGVKFPVNMRCIAAQNPPTDDYQVLDFDDAAFTDRFCHIKFEPSIKDWTNYARLEGVNPTIVNFIGEQPELLDAGGQDFVLDHVKPSRRSWIAVDEFRKICKNEPIFRELVIGMVGTPAAASYFEYVNKYEKALKPLDILDNWKKTKPIVETFSSNENNRQDMLRNVADGIKAELEKIDQLPKKWEGSLAGFLMTIPKDLGYGLIQEFFTVKSFLSTESDIEVGMAGAKFAASKKLTKHFEGWDQVIKDKEEKEANNDDIPF